MSKRDVIDVSLLARSTTERWRQFWAHDKPTKSSSCEPAELVRLSEDDFRGKIDKELTAEEQKFLKEAGPEQLQKLLQDCLDSADGKRIEHEQNRSLIGRVGKGTVRFVNNFSGFLQAYSGIVEVMNGADDQYGGLAFSTLSILLIVAVNKQRNEQQIDATLLTLQREFSRMKILEEFHHSTPTMQTYIAEAYRLGIEFAREATLYYSRKTYRRVLDAITKPPKLAIDKKTAAITEAMTQIEKERDTLDSKRLYKVQCDIDKLRGDVRGVDGKIEALHTQHERRLLAALKAKLVPKDYDSERDFDDYRIMVSNAFKNLPRKSPLDVDHLLQEITFKHWETSGRSCMMLLSGKTAATRTDFSWLTPATLYVADQCRENSRLTAIHCCHDEAFMEEDVPAQTVLSSIIYQLLEAKVTILRDQSRYQALSARISDAAWRASDLKAQFAVLHELLNDERNVYILIDRVDRIKGQPDRWVQPFVKLMKDSNCKLKILLVASSNGFELPEGKIDSDLVETLRYELGEGDLVTLVLDQR
ncbi:hypothetical protein MMC17_006719 [Xylographa soralifera]|nr:hypothetical protein [Xylographa soralifera]